MSTSSSIRLLPNEPRILNPGHEELLTERFLAPCLVELEQLFVSLRRQCDTLLGTKKPIKLGKPYPLGQCLEISQAVAKCLAELAPEQLTGKDVTAYYALQAFLAHGGSFRQVWGDLRGEYFQNAFLLGTLYIDVANDTVNLEKPPIEILPFGKAQFYPVADFCHFVRLAGCYWQETLYPNHLFPSLAPFFPLLGCTAAGQIHLHALTDYMVSLTCRGAFLPSEQVLDDAIEPSRFEALAQRIQLRGFEVPENAQQGRRMAVDMCRYARSEGYHQQARVRDTFIHKALQLNHRLSSG